MDDAKVTTLDLTLAHQDWKREMQDKLHSLKLWGKWYRETGGPEKWGEFAESVRRGIK